MCDAELHASEARYRIRFDENSPWRPLDRHCRDRLVVAAQFIAFIRYIRCVYVNDIDRLNTVPRRRGERTAHVTYHGPYAWPTSCRLGLYQHSTPLALYVEASRLRRQLLYCRMG